METERVSPFDDHFRNPRHAGLLPDADGRVEVENPACGDLLVLTWKRDPGPDAGRRLAEVRFQAYGCPAAIAAGSLLAERAAGADLADLAALEPGDIDAALGGLGESHVHAAVLAIDALRALLRREGALP